MRTHTLSPDARSLYYPPLLQDGHTEEAASRNRRSVRRRQLTWLGGLWRITVAIARSAGHRLIEARMEQARRQLDVAAIIYRIDPPAKGRGPAARYY